jgi:hypothetical protein
MRALIHGCIDAGDATVRHMHHDPMNTSMFDAEAYGTIVVQWYVVHSYQRRLARGMM